MIRKKCFKYLALRHICRLDPQICIKFSWLFHNIPISLLLFLKRNFWCKGSPLRNQDKTWNQLFLFVAALIKITFWKSWSFLRNEMRANKEQLFCRNNCFVVTLFSRHGNCWLIFVQTILTQRQLEASQPMDTEFR